MAYYHPICSALLALYNPHFVSQTVLIEIESVKSEPMSPFASFLICSDEVVKYLSAFDPMLQDQIGVSSVLQSFEKWRAEGGSDEGVEICRRSGGDKTEPWCSFSTAHGYLDCFHNSKKIYSSR